MAAARSWWGICRSQIRPVVLVWAKRLWRCAEPACATRTWSEESEEIAPRAVLTEGLGRRSLVVSVR
jgi:hypothetical protein